MNKKLASLLLIGAVVLAACSKDAETPATDPNLVKFTATVNGAQEVPATPSTATGTFNATLDKTTRLLTYEVTYRGLTPTMGHIHKGAPGTNGPVVVGFDDTAVKTSPVKGTATLRQSLADSLMNGLTYVNLHTAAIPTGEIRGNITMVK